MKASSINRRDTATDFWANAAKEIVAATGVLDKGAVLDKGVLEMPGTEENLGKKGNYR